MKTVAASLAFLILNTALLAGTVAAQSASPQMTIPAIAKAADGAVVSIIMSDKDGQPIAQGTGFLISKDGAILTNYHVIAEGSSAVVKLPDGAFYVVDGVLTSDKARDLAVIKAHGQNFRMLTLGNSDRIQVGEAVVAIGNPLSLESTVSNGIVSGIRTVQEKGGKFLQVTTPISPGSSGGPLFNLAGEVIGITTLYLEGGENLNFAIPVNDAKRLLLYNSSNIQALPNESETAETQTHGGDAPSSVKPVATTHKNPEDPVKVFIWANDLYNACQDDTVIAGDGILDVARKETNKGTCGGYILGYAEALSKSEGVCLPLRITQDEVIAGVKAVFDKSPNLRDDQLPASIAVGIALQEFFPCLAKQ